MSGSYSFFFHIVAVGFLFVIVFGGWAFNRKIVREKDLQLQLYISNWSRSIGILSPFVALVLLVTGIGNIYNRELGTTLHWYNEGWLVAKLIFFVIIVVNGSTVAALLGRKRTSLFRAISENNAPANSEELLKSYNRQFGWHYLVQFLLLAIIIYLSTFGDGKHPGVF